MSHEMEILTEKHPNIFGSNGSYAQASCFFAAALGAATVVGSLWSGIFYDQLGWADTSGSMALLCVCVSIPVLRYTGGSTQHKNIHVICCMSVDKAGFREAIGRNRYKRDMTWMM